MYSVHDWAEVHRLHHVEGLTKSAIAARLSMSRTTVHRLLALSQPPRYERVPLLVCDEVGYIPFEPEAAALFYALVASR